MDKQDFLITKLAEELSEVCTELLLQDTKDLEIEISDVLTIATLLNKDCNYSFDLNLTPSGVMFSDSTVNTFLLTNLNIAKLCSKSLIFGHELNKSRIEQAFKDFSKLVADLKFFNIISSDYKLTNKFYEKKVKKLNKFSPFNIVFM